VSSPDRHGWASAEQLAVRGAVRAALTDLRAPALVLVACSGGPDSAALAQALAYEAPRAGLRAGAVVVDHGLQAGSAATAAATAHWLGRAGLDPVEVVRVEVAGDGGPEASARQARYAALDEVAARTGAVAVLLGHTRDDQAETVLLGLARGSGARSLAGMSPVRGIYRRPLLGLARATVHGALDPEHPVVRDPHNADPAFARSRVRTVVLPLLEDQLGPGVAAALARTADLLRADAQALQDWADAEYEGLGADPVAGLHLDALCRLPAAVRARVLRRAAVDAGVPPGPFSAEHVRAIDALVVDWHGQHGPSLPGGVVVSRSCGRLTLAPPPGRGC
jgi:tRNA(Ile)-lysidine synthase